MSKKENKQPKVVKLLKKVTPTPMVENGLNDLQKIEVIEEHFKKIMETLGLDLSDDSLSDTPKRVAKMYVQETCSGLNPDNFPKITTIENNMKVNQMVLVKGISVRSLCEHHFQNIIGKAYIAYFPNKKVLGLSKFNRITEFFASRPQVQERLTKQIADCLVQVLGTEDVGVFIEAEHHCMISRGVKEHEANTVTSDLRGAFLRPEVRAEFFALSKN